MSRAVQYLVLWYSGVMFMLMSGLCIYGVGLNIFFDIYCMVLDSCFARYIIELWPGNSQQKQMTLVVIYENQSSRP